MVRVEILAESSFRPMDLWMTWLTRPPADCKPGCA